MKQPGYDYELRDALLKCLRIGKTMIVKLHVCAVFFFPPSEKRILGTNFRIRVKQRDLEVGIMASCSSVFQIHGIHLIML